MDINSTHTVYGNYMNLLQRLGKTYQHVPFGSLNERLDIAKDERPTPGTMPKIGYLMTGVGGHYNDIINNNIAIHRLYQHDPTDAAPFIPSPQILRPIANDLTPAQRAMYGLRRIETHGGEQYAAYYVRRFDTTNVVPRMEYRTINPDKSIVVSEFIPGTTNLNPVPAEVAVNGVNTTSSQFITVSAKVEIPWSRWQIDEYLNASKIMYGTEDAAIISETAICSAVDKVIQIGALSYTEAIAAYVETFAQAKIDLTSNSLDFKMLLDIGVSEPLYRPGS